MTTKRELKVIKKFKSKKVYQLVLSEEGEHDEIIAEVRGEADTLLLSYFIEKYLVEEIAESEEFKNYILDNVHKFPFLTVPTE